MEIEHDSDARPNLAACQEIMEKIHDDNVNSLLNKILLIRYI